MSNIIMADSKCKPSWLSAVNKINFGLNGATIGGKDVTFDFSGLILALASMPFKATASNEDTKITIKCKGFSSNVGNMMQGASKIRTLVLDTQDPIVAAAQFANSTGLYSLLGTPITVSTFGGTGNYIFINSKTLREIYLVPNKVASGGIVGTGVLIDASLVSIANALVGGLDTQQTIKITNATTKAKCDTILGIVSTVGEGDDAYDFFTQDQENGTVTLTEFITVTKGWTLA